MVRLRISNSGALARPACGPFSLAQGLLRKVLVDALGLYDTVSSFSLLRLPPSYIRQPAQSPSVMRRKTPGVDLIGFLVCRYAFKMEGQMIIGYARVGTDGQSLESQLASELR